MSDAPEVTTTPPVDERPPAPCGRCKLPRKKGETIGWAGLTLAHVSDGGVASKRRVVLCPTCTLGLTCWLERRKS